VDRGPEEAGPVYLRDVEAVPNQAVSQFAHLLTGDGDDDSFDVVCWGHIVYRASVARVVCCTVFAVNVRPPPGHTVVSNTASIADDGADGPDPSEKDRPFTQNI
jgi:hypothetical protein